MRHLIIFPIIFLGILLSCSEEVKPKPYGYTQVFTGENNKTWKIVLFEETLNGEVVDRFTISCSADDQYVFYANTERLFEARSGGVKCFVEPEPDVIEDSWSFNPATATLNMVIPLFADFQLPFIVKDAVEDEMELEIFIDQANTRSYRIYFESTDEE